MELNSSTAADFEKLVGQKFLLAEVENCELSLDRVEILTKHDQSPRAPFALVFRGEHAESLSQGMFELSNEETGALQIFLVPIGQSDGAFLYEAVFN